MSHYVRPDSYRRPVNAIYNIFPFTAIHAWILCNAVTGKSAVRSQFIEDLVEDLGEQFVLSRQNNLSFEQDKTLKTLKNTN